MVMLKANNILNGTQTVEEVVSDFESDIAKEIIVHVVSKVKELRELVWGEDIPSPCCPEYREHHESIQKILKFIDDQVLKFD